MTTDLFVTKVMTATMMDVVAVATLVAQRARTMSAAKVSAASAMPAVTMVFGARSVEAMEATFVALAERKVTLVSASAVAPKVLVLTATEFILVAAVAGLTAQSTTTVAIFVPWTHVAIPARVEAIAAWSKWHVVVVAAAAVTTVPVVPRVQGLTKVTAKGFCAVPSAQAVTDAAPLVLTS